MSRRSGASRRATAKRQCPALSCETLIPASMELCSPHWARVPMFLKTSLREAQARSGDHSIHHLYALREAIRLLAIEEGRDIE